MAEMLCIALGTCMLKVDVPRWGTQDAQPAFKTHLSLFICGLRILLNITDLTGIHNKLPCSLRCLVLNRLQLEPRCTGIHKYCDCCKWAIMRSRLTVFPQIRDLLRRKQCSLKSALIWLFSFCYHIIFRQAYTLIMISFKTLYT